MPAMSDLDRIEHKIGEANTQADRALTHIQQLAQLFGVCASPSASGREVPTPSQPSPS